MFPNLGINSASYRQRHQVFSCSKWLLKTTEFLKRITHATQIDAATKTGGVASPCTSLTAGIEKIVILPTILKPNNSMQQPKQINSEKQRVLLQLERLKRNFDSALQRYDQVSFLELSHSLRIWTELANPLVAISPEFSKAIVFKSANPTKELKAFAMGYPHVIALTPQGLPATADVRLGAMAGLRFNPAGAFLIGVTVFPDKEGKIRIQNPYYLGRSLDDGEHKVLYEQWKKMNASRLNFRQWLGSDAMRIGYIDADRNLQQVSLSRESLIKRVANILDGSHSSVFAQAENANDPALISTLQIEVQGIPLPYFVLLRIAEDIVHFAPKYIK